MRIFRMCIIGIGIDGGGYMYLNPVGFQTPEITKPLVSVETRGFVYIEFGGEGEMRKYPFALCETKPPRFIRAAARYDLPITKISFSQPSPEK